MNIIEIELKADTKEFLKQESLYSDKNSCFFLINNKVGGFPPTLLFLFLINTIKGFQRQMNFIFFTEGGKAFALCIVANTFRGVLSVENHVV